MLGPSKLSTAVCIVLGCIAATNAFTHPSVPHQISSKLMLEANLSDNNEITSRRGALFGMMAATVGAATVATPQEASARYSSYVNREKDWADRKEKGEINFKSARELKAELQEIAPMNSARSKIFCPNGPSSAVSPLMENKCGDQMAIPSVYGRTQDSVGNSIPGFATSYRSADLSNSGGFPSYK